MATALAHSLQLDLYDQRFNKFRWHSCLMRLGHSGQVSLDHLGLASLLMTSLGTGENDCHVPVIWRKNCDITDDAGKLLSDRSFRRYRKHLCELGVLFEINSGRGCRQKLKVLKFPGWSEIRALREAIFALESYCNRTGNAACDWVLRQLRRALFDREAAERAEQEPGAPDAPKSAPEGPETQPDTLSGTTGQSGRKPPLYMDLSSSGSVEESIHEESEQIEPPATPSTQDKRSPSGEVVKMALFERQKALVEAWKRLFAGFDVSIDEGCLMRLARAYEGRVERAGLLERGLFTTPNGDVETLDERLLRQFADGIPLGRVAQYLLKDASDFRVPDGRRGIDDGTDDPSTRPDKEPIDEATRAYLARVAELEAAGMEGFKAYEQTDAEWKARGLELP